MKDKSIKAVIFDWGGVLIDNPAIAIKSYCSNALGVDTERFEAAFRTVEEDFQRGALVENKFWQTICQQLGVPRPARPSLWGEALRHAYHPNQEMIDLAKRLREEGYRIALLSNTELPSVQIYNEQFPGFFDAAILSCLEHTRKPEPAIYELTLQKLSLSAEETIFVDDRPENIAGAEFVGMKAVLFTSAASLIQELTTLSVLIDGS